MYKIIIIALSTLTVLGCTQLSTPSNASNNLIIPPGLSNPEINSEYKMINTQAEGYQIDKIKTMKIVQEGSQRWLTIKGQKVDNVWPLMLSFLDKQGLQIKYQDKTSGIIETMWTVKNNTLPQTGVRGVFSWLGMGKMYSMPSQYMFKITIWQNTIDTNIFVTNTQMNEVYPNCVRPKNSSQETSDGQTTTWMAAPHNPQVELDFLLAFMSFNNIAVTNEIKVKSMQPNLVVASTALKSNSIIIEDNFDKAWWRVAVALERVGLGIVDKNYSQGEFYVYPLKDRIEKMSTGFSFFKKQDNKIQLPKAEYLVKLTREKKDILIKISDLTGQKEATKYLEKLSKEFG